MATGTDERAPAAGTLSRDRDLLRDILARRGPIEEEPCLGVFAEVLEPSSTWATR